MSSPITPPPVSPTPAAVDRMLLALRSWAIRFAACAALLLGLRLVAGIAGWSEHAQVLSGTQPGGPGSVYLGLLYVLLHGFSVLLVPPLLVSAGVLVGVWLRLRRPPQS